MDDIAFFLKIKHCPIIGIYFHFQLFFVLFCHFQKLKFCFHAIEYILRPFDVSLDFIGSAIPNANLLANSCRVSMLDVILLGTLFDTRTFTKKIK